MTTIAKLAAARGYTGHNPDQRRGRQMLRFAAALLALGTLAAPASAKPFQQYLNGNCTGKLCKITFAKVPAGSRLEVENVSCYMRLKLQPSGFDPEIRAAQLLVLGATPTTVLNAVTLVTRPFGSAARERIFSVNHPISASASANQRFQAYLELEQGSFSQFACHIGGELVKA